MFSAGDHSYAASTGRYAGGKAAAYVQADRRSDNIHRPNRPGESPRLCTDKPQRRHRVERNARRHCPDDAVLVQEFKTELVLNIGLDTLNEIQEVFVPRLYAFDPHKLMRSIEDLSLLTHAQIIFHASLARRPAAVRCPSSESITPIDPPEWNKFITIKLENNKVKTGELPLNYWGNMKANYEAHNRNYTGVYQGNREDRHAS